MNKIRRHLLLSGILGAASILSGCTLKLFSDKQYKVHVSSILISQDNKNIVVVDKEYHYIFDAPDVLTRTLTSPYHKFVKGSLGSFHVDGSGAITGSYLLSIGKDAPEKVKADGIAVGFVYAGENLIYGGKLSGYRYSSGGIQAKVDSQRLNKTYIVDITAEQSTLEKSAKSLLTPITVAADGVLLIGGIYLMSAYWLGLLAGCLFQDDPMCRNSHIQ